MTVTDDRLSWSCLLFFGTCSAPTRSEEREKKGQKSVPDSEACF